MPILISRRTWVRAALTVPLASALKAQTTLKVEDAFLSDVESGEKADALRGFSAGEKVFLDFKIGGFETSGDPPRANLEYQVRAVDQQGTLLAPPDQGTVDVEITPEDKHWRPRVRSSVEIPEVSRSGEHKFLIRIEDKIAKTETTGELPIRVYSNLPESPENLSIFEMKLLQTEDAGKSVEERPSFHPGDKLFARFYLTGYRFAVKNTYRLQYGISLRDSVGKVLLSVPNAAAESSNSFYPKRYVACAFSVDLERNIRPGQYTLTVVAKDLIGKQEVESAHLFFVQ